MRRWLSAMIVAFVAMGQASAQELKMSDVFRQMPDSLLPYLSQNNRLDFIDFIESGMKAKVTNQLDGTSEMTALADDSLSIRMSESLRIDLLLLNLSEPVDSVSQAVVMIESFLTDSIYGESRVSYYTPEWQLMTKMPPLSESQIARIRKHKVQNIVKKDDEIINER